MTTSEISKKRKITGWIVSGLVILFMLFDAALKFAKPVEVVKTTVNELGFQEHHILALGILGLLVTILYAIPRTSVFGAILLTAYLGGAASAHLRIDNPLFSHVLFPSYIALLAWGGLWLRNFNLRKLIPLIQQ